MVKAAEQQRLGAASFPPWEQKGKERREQKAAGVRRGGCETPTASHAGSTLGSRGDPSPPGWAAQEGGGLWGRARIKTSWKWVFLGG